MTSPDTCRILYCEGWDADAARPVGVLDADTARARDAAGEQYAVLVRDEAAAPLLLVQVAWSHDHCAVLRFGADRRIDARYRYVRRSHGGLSLTRARWRPARERTVRGRPVREIAVRLLDEDTATYQYRYGFEGSTGHVNRGPDADLAPFTARPAPVFGDWDGLLDLHPLFADAAPALRVDAVDPDPEPVPAPWRPPEPLSPVGVDALFRPGGRFRDGRSDAVGTVEVHPAGTLALPTGRAVVTDPSLPAPTADRELTVALPPGEHPVRLSVLRLDGDASPVAGVRVDVADTPVTRWDMALRPDQDPRDLDDGGHYGVGADGGVISLCDASGLPALAEALQGAGHLLLSGPGHPLPPDLRGRVEVTGPWSRTLTEPLGGGNLVVASTGQGDGVYPVWVGRGADGDVAALVVDTGVLRDAEPADPADSAGDADAAAGPVT